MLTNDTAVTLISDGERVSTKLPEILDMICTDSELIIESYKSKLTTATISSIRTSDSKDFVYIKTCCDSMLMMTPDHKIYLPENKEWVRAENVSKGLCVLLSNGTTSEISSTHIIADNTVSRVYSLAISPTQCFFANNILVHNEG